MQAGESPPVDQARWPRRPMTIYLSVATDAAAAAPAAARLGTSSWIKSDCQYPPRLQNPTSSGRSSGPVGTGPSRVGNRSHHHHPAGPNTLSSTGACAATSGPSAAAEDPAGGSRRRAGVTACSQGVRSRRRVSLSKREYRLIQNRQVIRHCVLANDQVPDKELLRIFLSDACGTCSAILINNM